MTQRQASQKARKKARKASRKAETALLEDAIRTADSERPLAAASPASGCVQSGDLVLLTGLGSSELNGLTGTVVARVARRAKAAAAAERWTVDVPAHGRSYRLPPENLRTLRASVTPGAQPAGVGPSASVFVVTGATHADTNLSCTVCRSTLPLGTATSDDDSGHRLCTPCVALRDAAACSVCRGPRSSSYDIVRMVRAEGPGPSVHGDALAYCSKCYHTEVQCAACWSTILPADSVFDDNGNGALICSPCAALPRLECAACHCYLYRVDATSSTLTGELLCYECADYGGTCACCCAKLLPADGTPVGPDNAPWCPSCCLLLNAAVCGGCTGPRELRDPSSVADGVAYCASCVAAYEGSGDEDDDAGDGSGVAGDESFGYEDNDSDDDGLAGDGSGDAGPGPGVPWPAGTWPAPDCADCGSPRGTEAPGVFYCIPCLNKPVCTFPGVAGEDDHGAGADDAAEEALADEDDSDDLSCYPPSPDAADEGDVTPPCGCGRPGRTYYVTATPSYPSVSGTPWCEHCHRSLGNTLGRPCLTCAGPRWLPSLSCIKDEGDLCGHCSPGPDIADDGAGADEGEGGEGGGAVADGGEAGRGGAAVRLVARAWSQLDSGRWSQLDVW